MDNTMEDSVRQAERFMNELDELASSKLDMTIKEAQEILDDFARVSIYLNESSFLYPSSIKPESLLPRKREKIRTAFAVGLKYAKDSERKSLLYLNYSQLEDGFRPDAEAG